jgi:outer membrane autotransporter protein
MFHLRHAFILTRVDFLSNLLMVLLFLLFLPVSAFATLTISPSTINFGEVEVGTTSSVSIVRVFNSDPQLSVILSSITDIGDFSHTTNCPRSLGPGLSCSISVRFAPQSSGNLTGRLSIVGDDPSLDITSPNMDIPAQARAFNYATALSGIGISGELSTTSSNIDFGSVTVNNQSQVVSVPLTNSGSATTSITGISATTPFEQTNDCPSSLAAGESCTIQVTVTPDISGAITGSLQITGTTQADTLQETISLAVSGVAEVTTISPASLSFTQIATGTSSEPLTVTLENQNNTTIQILSISTEGDFSQSNDCAQQLGASESCTIQVTFAPQATGTQSGALIISTDIDTRSIPLSGTADPSASSVATILLPYAGGNPNVISTTEVIADACTSGRISERMQEDCNDVVDAADQGDTATATALSQITPESATKANKTSRQGSETQNRNLGSRITALRAGARGLSFQGLSLRTDDQNLPIELISQAYNRSRHGGGASEDNPLLDSKLGIFITGDISTGSKDKSDLEAGLDFHTYGVTIGLDYRINNQFILGGAMGYIDTNTELENSAGETDTQGYSLSLYGTYYRDQNYFIDFSASYGSNNFDQSRRIDYSLDGLADVKQKLTADYDGNMFSLFIGSGYDFTRDAWTFGPRADLEYIKSDIDGFTEKVSDASADGGGWATRVDATDQKWLTLKLGGKLSYTHSADWGVLIPYTRLDLLHEFKDDSQVISAHFISDPAGNTIRIESDDPDRNYMRLRLGTSAQFQNGMVGFIDFSTLLAHSDWSAHTLSIGFRTEF